MTLSDERKDKIRKIVEEILSSREQSFPEDAASNRNAPFHDKFLDAFRDKLKVASVDTPYLVAIASWMHGLNTTLGQKFFESSAHILSGGGKRKFDNVTVTQSQATVIDQIMSELTSRTHPRLPNLQSEDQAIADALQKGGATVEVPAEFTADTYRETRTEIIAIELKTVRPNKGGGRDEKRKILLAKAALKRLYPEKQVKFFIGFPFDPTSNMPTGYDKKRFIDFLIGFKKFFDPREVLLASELWDYLSDDENTMEQLLDIVSEAVDDFSSNNPIDYP